MAESVHSRGWKKLPTATTQVLQRDQEEHSGQDRDHQDQSGTGQSKWKRGWQRAWTYFETRAQQKWDQQRRQRDAERERIDADPQASEQDRLRLLREETAQSGRSYMDSLRDSNVLAPGFNDDEREEKVSALHSVYAQMMVANCLKPLKQGINASSVVRSASTMATMYLLSSTFRQATREYIEPVSTAIRQRIDRKAESEMQRGQEKAEFRNYLMGDRSQPATAEEYVSTKWQRRYEDLQYRQRGHRQMYTPRSAGMTEVALTENAFFKMREPGADTKTIAESYKAMIELLYQQAEDDGLSREEVAQSSRVVLGERVKDDPRVQTMISNLAHGQQRMSAPHEERIAGTDRTQTVWRGDFEDYCGQDADLTRYQDPENREGIIGAFTLRENMDHADHRSAMGETIAATMADSARQGDMEGFNQDMAGYLMGCVARAQQVDGEGMSGDVPQRLFQSRTMLASMAADGMDIDEQHLLFSSAYSDALEAVQEVYPEFCQQWDETYGQQWQAFTERVGADPQQAYQQWLQNQPDPGPSESEPGFDPPEAEHDSGDYQPA